MHSFSRSKFGYFTNYNINLVYLLNCMIDYEYHYAQKSRSGSRMTYLIGYSKPTFISYMNRTYWLLKIENFSYPSRVF